MKFFKKFDNFHFIQQGIPCEIGDGYYTDRFKAVVVELEEDLLSSTSGNNNKEVCEKSSE